MTSSLGKDAKMALNGPVFFLVQEQAKSIVAIQALQSRMAVLEGLQERLMRAIDDVQHHLTPPKILASSAKTSSNSDKKLRFSDLEACAYPEEACIKAKSDSLNKDSGIGNSDTSCSFGNGDRKTVEEDDELLQLLDLIDERGAQLFKQLEGCQLQQRDSGGPMGDCASGGPVLDDLLFEKVDTQRQLSEVKAERDDLRQRLARLELATRAVQSEKMKVQEQLDLTLRENQSLQDRIQTTVRGTGQRSESLGFMEDIEKANIKRKYLQFSEQSRRRVSQILKETNPLELQKQLLTYVMENDVLRAKLQQSQPARLASWLKTESKLRSELREALQSNQRLQEAFKAKDLEIASLKDRIRALEESGDSCVQNFGMGSNEDWREPGVYGKRSNLNVRPAAAFQSPLGYGDFSKTQSLPAMLLAESRARQQQEQQQQQQHQQQQHQHQQYSNVYDTSSFTDVPLNHSLRSDADDQSSLASDGCYSKDLVDLSVPAEPTLPRPSRPLQPGLSVPNLAAGRNWGQHQQGSRLVNGHLCWKGPPLDLSSVCSEFDPLSDDACENFVDSLNLSAPMKPAQTGVARSQLSSVGDSLHSASLDLDLQDTRHSRIARSADGIRDLFLDSAWCHKRPQSIGVGAPVLRLGKPRRQMPVNLMHNCLHESSDFSLL